MSTSSRMERSLTILRDCGPYVLIELLLPGGTLIALLVYLSRRFVRGGLSNVQQVAARRAVDATPVMTKPRPGKTRVCLCPGHTTVVRHASGTFEQRCEQHATLAACCA